MFNKLPMYQNIGESAYKKDLSNIILICEHLNNPHNNFKSIHIGGTNGKGSCSHMLSSILQEANYKVGLYTSPHLFDFRERIKINGDMISKDSVLKFMHENFDFFESNNLSFFEMTVGLAFDYFSKNKVDIAIIEVGMGGRLDSTNIINPILSIITNISLDHTRFLGSNIFDIAKEKAGIIKENIPLVIGETQQEISPIFNDIAKSKNSEIIFADHHIYDNYDSDLKGNYQKKNIKTVLKSTEILKQLDYKINDSHIKTGLNNVSNNTGLEGRWHVIQRKPMIICDTAHNEAALREVISQLMDMEYSDLHFIIGFSNDKNLKKISKIFPEDSKYYFVQSKVGRARDAKEVRDIFKLNNRCGDYYKSIENAIKYVKGVSKENDIIFIVGSTFVVSEIFDKN
uniref:Dihydrofolate synthase/folylpolyglutamate synthase n=1 Tax=uncultured Flavobacteriia bacterium TaxID=212695 RepID=F4MN67_9BACT|nr:tetrahydrofolate synthase [uncultured bacterium]CBL87580.1 folylpolyglutamate synthase [uncultured Flavobacteriia bacterium]